MNKLLSQSALTFSKREYLVDLWDNGAMVVHRQKSAVAIASKQDGEWCFTGGKVALFRAAVKAVGGTVCEETVG
jgi:hypothetical protein